MQHRLPILAPALLVLLACGVAAQARPAQEPRPAPARPPVAEAPRPAPEAARPVAEARRPDAEARRPGPPRVEPAPADARRPLSERLVVPKAEPRRPVVPEKKPVTYGSAERTKLLSQGRAGKDGTSHGSVERRAAIEGKAARGSRQAPRRPRN